MKIKQVKIKSYNIFLGMNRTVHNHDKEERQELLIYDTGKVHFVAYNYENRMCRDISIDIGIKSTEKIIERISQYFEGERKAVKMDDVGWWEIEIMYANGDTDKCEGALVGGVFVSEINLTELIRKEISIENMFVFDM